jgi:hypothetical protein
MMTNSLPTVVPNYTGIKGFVLFLVYVSEMKGLYGGAKRALRNFVSRVDVLEKALDFA